MREDLMDMCKGHTGEWIDGLEKGILAFAWWKDGVEYIGTTGSTFKEAKQILDEIRLIAYKERWGK